MNKKCFKCNKIKSIDLFYKNKRLTNGYLGKCKECTLHDNKNSIGLIVKKCFICKKTFKVSQVEINKGGGFTCSRVCYYDRLRKIIKKDKDSPNWKGNKVGNHGLHDWVKRKLGKPSKCEHCKSEVAKKYEWANKSQKYKRDINDWLRLCTKCHADYDRPIRMKKYLKSMQKHYARYRIERKGQLLGANLKLISKQ
jgi:hypothetical protein